MPPKCEESAKDAKCAPAKKTGKKAPVPPKDVEKRESSSLLEVTCPREPLKVYIYAPPMNKNQNSRDVDTSGSSLLAKRNSPYRVILRDVSHNWVGLLNVILSIYRFAIKPTHHIITKTKHNAHPPVSFLGHTVRTCLGLNDVNLQRY